MVLAWPNPSHCSQLKSERAGAKSVSPSVFHILPFKLEKNFFLIVPEVSIQLVS